MDLKPILFQTFFIFISKLSHEISWPQSAKLAIAPFKPEIDWKLTILRAGHERYIIEDRVSPQDGYPPLKV